jgi:hypothetical protein
VVGPQA